jgi:predicted nucleotidyltransferase
MLVMSGNGLDHLSPTEREAIIEFVRLLGEQFGNLVSSVALFGSKARGDSTLDSDLDVLVVVDSDDWRVHKRIRYLAADICLRYDIDLSPRVWSISHRQEMEELRSLLYQNVRRDSINLLEISGVTG